MFAADIETEDWDRFVVGGVLSDTGHWVCHDWHTEREFAEYLLSLEGEVWGHNAGRYDWLWLTDWIRRLRMTAEVFATSARITLIKVGRAEFRDSAALCPLPLKVAAGIGGKLKLETGLECLRDDCKQYRRTGKECGGYCAIRRDMDPIRLARLKVYLRGDCDAVIDGIIKPLRSYADKNGIELAGTIGSASWKTAKNELGLNDAEWNPPRLYSRVRRGYYGGRVQVFRPASKHGKRWDINSAYIAALTKVSLPYGRIQEVGAIDAKRSYEKEGKEGIFNVQVSIPKQHIPPLPWRDSKERVWFPTGDFWGTWTALELRYAVDTSGVRILEYGPSIVWSDSAPILSPWAQRVWDLRHAAGKSTSIGKWLKWFGNSLTGKLAQRPETDVCKILPEPPPPCDGSFICGGVLCGMSDRCCKHRCVGACGVMRPVGRDSGVWAKEVWRLSKNAHVQWAAYLTARARTWLHYQLVSDGDGGRTAVYCDTDSCYAERDEALNVGDDLGQFMYEGAYNDFRALAPKTYSFIDAEPTSKTYMERIVKAKGIPEPDWQGMLAGDRQAISSGVKQFKSAVRDAGRKGTNVFIRRDTHRTVTADKFGDRAFEPGSDVTVPYDFQEIK
jgi:hypothetical protein